MSQQKTPPDTQVKKICCDIFRTEFTHEGVVVIFEDVAQYVPKLIFKSEPITYTAYIEFINSELCKLRKDAGERPHSAPLKATHKGNKICFDYLSKDALYRVNPISLALYTEFFMRDYETIQHLAEEK